MIYRDEHGYIVTHDGDGGDSANRAGLHALCTPSNAMTAKLRGYEVQPGILTRHPLQYPWDNPWNFTRDQLLPFVAGCWKQRHWGIARRVFWAHAKRLFFCQNFERDAPGTTKYPWPHEVQPNKWGKYEERSFDFADILMPNDIGHLILCGRMWYLYWLLPVTHCFLLFAVVGHCLWHKSDDETQIIAECIVAGAPFVRLYKRLKPTWRESLQRYWCGWREEQTLCSMIIWEVETY